MKNSIKNNIFGAVVYFTTALLLNSSTSLLMLFVKENSDRCHYYNGKWIPINNKEDNTQNSQIEHLLNIINEKANKKDVYTIAQTNDAINRSKTVVENVLTSTSTTTALSSAQGKILNDLITSLTARVQALETPKP